MGGYVQKRYYLQKYLVVIEIVCIFACEKSRNEKSRISKLLRMNPFKYGTLVQDEFFTDRINELAQVKQLLDSENHLVLISPRRFGKSSLIAKALKEVGRPSITIDLMKVNKVEELASLILKGIFQLYPLEKIKHLLSHFRIAPTVSYNPLTDGWDVTFMPSIAQSMVALEDALDLLQKVSVPENRMVVVFDEFQECTEIDKGLLKLLRAVMQRQSGLNYIFMGSQESMMEEIFEKEKSPFYHFGQRMSLQKIPYKDFFDYIVDRLPSIEGVEKAAVANEILNFTMVHPYYSQQLAAAVYNQMVYNSTTESVVEVAINLQVQEHSLDYERLWANFKRTDRMILTMLAQQENPLTNRMLPTSTAFSSLKRLIKQGYIIKSETYEIEDPFFGRWIKGGSC